MVDVSQADYDYYNAGMKKIETASSVLVSSSKYLNHSGLRELIAQEMLRRNGTDLPNTAYIPEVAQILHDLEDMPQVFALFEQEKARLPEFRTWLERRELSNFKIEEVRHCAPGTLGSVIHDFLANSGYSIDHFFQGLEVTSDYTFYLKERAYTHDIEHMITGFETNDGFTTGAGNDRFDDNGGADSYTYALGDGAEQHRLLFLLQRFGAIDEHGATEGANIGRIIPRARL